MKIVHIIHSLRGGGIQNFILSLAPEQATKGNNVTVIVIDKYDSDYCEPLENILKNNNIETVRLNKKRGDKISFINAISCCRRLIKKINPDIVNSHAEISHLYGSVATMFTNISHVLTVHNAPEHWNGLLRFVSRNKPLIFCSHAAYELRQQESNSMIAIDNGISRNIVHSDDVVDLRKQNGLMPNDKVIVSAGSLRPQKNYSFLKDIVDELKDDSYHFFVCGGGNVSEGNIDISEFKEYKNIHFLGLRSDVSAIENGADLFLSCASFEGLPIAVLEAYFNGIPCVLSPIEQHQKISAVERVWIPSDFTASAFVRSIKEAFNNLGNHDDIYKLRIPQIAQYSISKTAVKYEEFYSTVINSKW